MSKLIDKLIIVLLISSIPIGIYASSKLDNKTNQEVQNADKVKLDKIDQVINNLNEIKQKPKVTPLVKIKKPELKISSAEKTAKYELTIKGKTPRADLYVMATEIITYLKPTPLPKIKQATNSAISNTKPIANSKKVIPKDTINAQAVKPNSSNEFVVKLPISDNMNIIQIKFEQGEITKTIQFSVKENKLLQ